MDGGCKRAFCLWHRRAGKDVTLWNLTIREAHKRVGVYFYLLPTYTQGKKIIWDGITNDGDKFMDYIPRQIIRNQNGQELKIKLKNGSIIQIIGTDNYDAIRGTNPVGCVFSEYSFQNPMAWEVVKPILKVNKGWAIFNTTPNGKNHAYDLYNMAMADDNWFCECLTIEDTEVLNDKDMEEERQEGMTEEMIAQEYFCSFDVGALGSYYPKQLKEAAKRITGVPREANLEIEVFFDLGKNDSTTMLFVQQVGREIHIFDAYEASGESIEHYVKVLKDKEYMYGHLNLPHDAKHRRLESNKTIEEQFKEAGFKTRIVEKLSIDQGIQQVRRIFPRLWIDKVKCKQFLRAIENYHKEYDEVAKVFKNTPKHDWSSHYADALRYLAVGIKSKNIVDHAKLRALDRKLEEAYMPGTRKRKGTGVLFSL